MQRASILFAVLISAGCKPSPPRDCATARRKALQCLSHRYPGGNHEALLACFPFSKPERIEGAWVEGFEHNQFFEGQRASAAQLRSEAYGTQLETDMPTPSDGRLRAIQVQFIGRRSLCDMGYSPNVIIVDRFMSSAIKAVTR
jgi:hypothetical protein